MSRLGVVKIYILPRPVTRMEIMMMFYIFMSVAGIVAIAGLIWSATKVATRQRQESSIALIQYIRAVEEFLNVAESMMGKGTWKSSIEYVMELQYETVLNQPSKSRLKYSSGMIALMKKLEKAVLGTITPNQLHMIEEYTNDGWFETEHAIVFMRGVSNRLETCRTLFDRMVGKEEL